MTGAARTTAVWLHGSSGRMGRAIQKTLVERAQGLRLLGGSARTFEGETFLQGRPVTVDLLADALVKDKVELVLDFSTPEANALLRDALAKTKPAAGLAVLIGTTGLDDAALAAWAALARRAGHAQLVAPNTSLGVLLMARAALTAAAPLAKLGFDLEITETHHRQKRDAPSGTAKFLAAALAAGIPGKVATTRRDGARRPEEIGVHSVRGGGVFGEHEIAILGDHEEIKITHRAFSRALFADGALVMARWLMRQKPGVYHLEDIDAATL